jgi:hypothetical protein
MSSSIFYDKPSEGKLARPPPCKLQLKLVTSKYAVERGSISHLKSTGNADLLRGFTKDKFGSRCLTKCTVGV